MRARDREVENESEGWGVENESEGWGVETGGGDGSETGLVTKKGQKSTTVISATLCQPHPGYRVKEMRNNMTQLDM